MEDWIMKWGPPLVLILGFLIGWWRERISEVKRQAKFEEQLVQLRESMANPHNVVINQCRETFNNILADVSTMKSEMGQIKGSLQTLITMLNMGNHNK